MPTVNPPRIKAIMRAAEQIALELGSFENGVPAPFTGSKLYAGPTPDQIATTGTPYLSVMKPKLMGYADDSPVVSDEAAHGVSNTQPVWDIDIMTFHPFDAGDPTPGYEDAAEDAFGLHRVYMESFTLPFTSLITSVTSASVFAVAPGDGARFAVYGDELFIGGVPVGSIQAIDGDTLTLWQPANPAPAVGVAASQGTCYNSYPYNTSPDYAELTDGNPWCVGYLVLRVFEELAAQFP